LRGRLEEMAGRHAIIGDVRGAGLLQGVEFVQDRATRKRFAASVRPGKVVEAEAKRRGLLLRCANDFVAFAPPLTATEAEIETMTGLLGESIAAATALLAAA
jgi:adenosylmethionine-8-amino-7-oxononanoate aminotransferase